jgi:hypothetical protein
VVSGEVLKVSYIRQIKTDRFAALTWTLLVSVVLFAALMGADAALPKATKPQTVLIEGPVTVRTPTPIITAPNPNPPQKNVSQPNASPKQKGKSRSPGKVSTSPSPK